MIVRSVHNFARRVSGPEISRAFSLQQLAALVATTKFSRKQKTPLTVCCAHLSLLYFACFHNRFDNELLLGAPL